MPDKESARGVTLTIWIVRTVPAGLSALFPFSAAKDDIPPTKELAHIPVAVCPTGLDIRGDDGTHAR